jgi:sugar O-acyltransferase (sialic acid O-acetyltransferase NeuD family)
VTDLVFWGATGQARVLREAVQGKHRLVAIFDNRKVASPFADVPIFVGEEGFASWSEGQPKLGELRACVAIGGDRGMERLAIQEWLARRGVLPITVVHGTAFVASDSLIGEGCQILAMSAICANARIGRSAIVNTAASVDHCCIVGDGSHIGPGARLAGEVTLGANVFIGTGAVVLPRIQIGEGAVVGAGSVVTRNVAARDVVFGNPARSKK